MIYHFINWFVISHLAIYEPSSFHRPYQSCFVLTITLYYKSWQKIVKRIKNFIWYRVWFSNYVESWFENCEGLYNGEGGREEYEKVVFEDEGESGWSDDDNIIGEEEEFTGALVDASDDEVIVNIVDVAGYWYVIGDNGMLFRLSNLSWCLVKESPIRNSFELTLGPPKSTNGLNSAPWWSSCWSCWCSSSSSRGWCCWNGCIFEVSVSDLCWNIFCSSSSVFLLFLPLFPAVCLKWIFMCLARWSDLVKALSQCVHTKLLSPVWVFACRVSSSDLNVFQFS